jgi:gliding motility-associated-like protein
MGKPSKVLLFLLCLLPSIAAKPEESCAACTALVFKENKGQWHENVLYKAEMHYGSTFFEKAGITYALLDTGDMKNYRSHHPFQVEYNAELNGLIHGAALRCHFVNANPNAQHTGNDKIDEYFNYFIGKDRSKWKSRVGAFKQLIYTDIYSGTDLHVYSDGPNIKYDWIVKAQGGASGSKMTCPVMMKYDGAEKVSLDNGKLIIKTAVCTIEESTPYAYQYINNKKVEVPCDFSLSKEGIVSFSFPKGYDSHYDLIVDPTLIFSTYSGSTADNFGYTATYDSKGNAYAAGSVFAIGYPTTTGAFQTTWLGGVYIPGYGFDSYGVDVGITKYKADGTVRLFSTYLGGSKDELPHSLVVNSNDELIVFGTTSSGNFPVTANAFDTTYNGGDSLYPFGGLGVQYDKGSDIFVTRFNQNGTGIIGSTYIGGSGNDGLNYPEYSGLNYQYADEVRGVVDVDANDNIYVATCTRSKNFPVTAGAYQRVNKGGIEGVLVKMSSNLSQMVWGTYLGGERNDAIYSLALDTFGNVFVCGGTTSDTFPSTAGAYQTVNRGGRADGFITLFNKNGSGIIASTFYGTPTYDQLFFVQTDHLNNVFVLGQTFDTTGAFTKNVRYNIPKSGQYISKFNHALDTLIWSSRFGTGNGQPDISPTAFLVDRCNSIYVAGWGSDFRRLFGLGVTLSTTGMYVTPNAYQSITDGNDFYVMVMKDDASAISYATYFGSPISEDHVDGGTSRFDKKGVIYESVCAGCGANSAFPTYPANVVSHTNNSPNCNNAIFKLDLQVPLIIADFQTPPSACDTFSYTFINKSYIFDTANTLVHWSFGDGGSSTALNPTHTYTRGGVFSVTLTLIDSTSCNVADSITKKIIIHQNDSTIQLPTLIDCGGTKIQIGFASIIDTAFTYQWIPSKGLSDTAITDPYVTPDRNQNYELILKEGNCRTIYKQNITVEKDSLIVTGADVFCPDDTVQLHARDTTHIVLTYSWSPISQIISGGTTASPFVKPPQTTTYVVTAHSSNGCVYTDSIKVHVTSSTQVISTSAVPDTIGYRDTSTLHVFYHNAASVVWDSDPTLSSLYVDSPYAYPLIPKTYWVTVTDQNGCKKRDSVNVYIRYTQCSSDNLYVPNAFSPNNDGKNDKLFVRGNFVKDMYFTIYDRWGQKVFETHDQGTGWDGSFNGTRLDPSVFGWYLEGTCETGERFFKKGNVTLLR